MRSWLTFACRFAPAAESLMTHLRGVFALAVYAGATAGDGSRLSRFNAAHFAPLRDFLIAHSEEPHATVTPVGIAYTRRHGVPLGRLGRSEVAWYGDTDLLPHLWALVIRGG